MASTPRHLGLLTTVGLVSLMAAGCSSAPTAPEVRADGVASLTCDPPPPESVGGIGEAIVEDCGGHPVAYL